MTKKDYELIANSLHRAYICLDDDNELDKQDILVIIRHLCMSLELENPRFDPDKFLKACGIVNEPYNDYNCLDCGKVFHFKSEYSNHKQTNHKGV